MATIRDAQGCALHPCFGYERCDPETCTHPLEAQFASSYIDVRLMLGKKLAPDQSFEPAHVTWPPPAKPKKTEYWRREVWCYQVRCFACGTVLNDFAWLWADTGRRI